MDLRVMTYNVLDGGIGREGLLLEVLRAANPDIVVLQEAFDEAFVRRLAIALHMQHFFAHGSAKHHLALMSRWPIIASHSRRAFPSLRRRTLESTVELPNGRRVDLFGVHPVPFPNLVLELWRLWEIKTVLTRVRQWAPAHCLIVGDFNAIAPGDRPQVNRLGVLVRTMVLMQGNRIFRMAIGALLKAGMADCFRDLHPESDGFTYGPPKPKGRIDYIFANPAMRAQLRECSVVREPAAVDLASDHYPVVASFSL